MGKEDFLENVMVTGKETFTNRNAREGASHQRQYSSTPWLIRSPLPVRGPAPAGMCRSAFCRSWGPWRASGMLGLCCCEYSCWSLSLAEPSSQGGGTAPVLQEVELPLIPCQMRVAGTCPGTGLRAVPSDSSSALAPLGSRFVLSTCKPPPLLGREGSNSTENAVSTLLSKGFTRSFGIMKAGAAFTGGNVDVSRTLMLALPQTCPGHF